MKTRNLIVVALATLGLVFTATPTAFAETRTTVTPAKEIVVRSGQNLNGATSNAVNDANRTGSAGKTITNNTMSGAKKVGSDAANVATDLAKNTNTEANQFAGSGINSTGLDLFKIFDRFDKLLSDGGSNIISLLLKLFYWSSAISIVVGFVMTIWAALPFTKMKVWKPLIGLISSFIFFGIITSIAGISFFDNPIVALGRYLFTGQ